MAAQVEAMPITVAFRPGTRVPRGATPEGILAEHQQVLDLAGEVTAQTAARLTLEREQEFPMLRSFGPATPEQAFIRAMEDGVRYAFASVVVVHQRDNPGGQRPEVVRLVRVLHAVPMIPGGALEYRRIELISRDEEQRRYLIEKLRTDAGYFSRRMEDTLAEISELL